MDRRGELGLVTIGMGPVVPDPRTAKALGITIPQSILVRVDRVIE